MQMRVRIPHYVYLMRLDKPIGILLLLWPTLWALWLSNQGHPDPKILFIFVAGVLLMRSAGCVMNDIADRNLDKHVARTKERPIAAKRVTTIEALCLAAFLSACAFLLVLFCNQLTIILAIVAALIAVIYPYLKRFIAIPQLGLSIAFTFGVPMAFAAQTGAIPFKAWVLFFTGMIWPLIYDTLYAMVDREDDIKIGIQSSAILFGKMDRIIIAFLQCVFLGMLSVVGLLFHLKNIYYFCLLGVALLFLYQLSLIKHRAKDKCFAAFLNNNWVGMMIFVGIVLSYLQ